MFREKIRGKRKSSNYNIVGSHLRPMDLNMLGFQSYLWHRYYPSWVAKDLAESCSSVP